MQAGLTAQRAGQAGQAEQAYRRALSLDPHNPDALQLLGLLAKSVGRSDLAADFMRQSLAANAMQPHVWGNLGNLHLAEGRAGEALDCYERALALAPGDAGQHYHRAKALHNLGRFDAAEAACRSALRLAPDHAPSLIMLGLALTSLGPERQAEAEALYRRVLDKAPDNSVALTNLAALLRQQHRYAEAEPLCRRAVAVAPAGTEAWLLLGNVQGDLSHYADSIASFQAVIARDPTHRDAHRNLARRLWTLGRNDEVFDAIYKVMRALPGNAQALDIAAEIQAEFGFLDAAMQNSSAALALAPNDPVLQRRQADLLLRLDRPIEAAALLDRLVADAPDHIKSRNDLALAQLRAGDREAAARTAAQTLHIAPYDQYALALLATLRRLDGTDGEEEIGACVAIFDLPPPPGWDDAARFHADCLAVLDRLHDTVNEPIHLTLRKGTQTSANLFAQSLDAPLAGLRDQIDATLKAYIDSMPVDAAHPYFGRGRQGLAFAGSWSSRLRNGGFHTHHIHPEGWISGVYYLQVPPAADAGDQAGWLTFGVPNLGPETSLPALHAVQPKPGRLVLFPSYLWHGTVPFQDDIPRITIAFDVIPV